MLSLRPPSNPKRILKMVVGFSLILLVLWVFTMYQTDESTTIETFTAEEQAKLDTLRQMLGREDIALKEGGEENFFPKALTVFLILGGGIILIWFLFRNNETLETADLVTAVAEQDLGNGQFLKIVKFQNEYWVLGITIQSITLLKTISEDDWNLNDYKPAKMKSLKPGFASILESLKK